MTVVGEHAELGLEEKAFELSDALDLLDWKRRIFRLYEAVRAASEPAAAWEHWREVRERLYRTHPQSPLVPRDRPAYRSSYFVYDPAFRVVAELANGAATPSLIPRSTGGTFAFSRIGVARFVLCGSEHEIEVHWNEGYGGGILVAVADETSGKETYGGGRYVLDTVKGADLGNEGGRLMLDFNFAFSPSCAFDQRWACPLAPPANRLPIRLEAGERVL
jgi:uncharacterized protein (DUF1684 family)